MWVGNYLNGNQIFWNHAMLNDFRNDVKYWREDKDKDRIIRVLKIYAEKKYRGKLVYFKKYRSIRNNSRSIFDTRRKKETDECYACFTKYQKNDRGKVTIIHHILMLINGGLDIKKNRLVLCRQCHSLVHSWLNNNKYMPSKNKNPSCEFELDSESNLAYENSIYKD